MPQGVRLGSIHYGLPSVVAVDAEVEITFQGPATPEGSFPMMLLHAAPLAGDAIEVRGELRDADEQRRRFDVVAGLRASLGLPALPLDLAFLADLRDLGLPACCGVALGLDRLLMVAAGADTLAALTLSLAPRVGEPGT